MRKAIGIDLGRSPAVGILSDIEGNILERRQIDIPMDAPFEYSAEILCASIARLRHQEVAGIGVGAPGLIDSKNGVCHFSPNYPLWKETDILSPLKERLKLPVFVLNDVNCAALGEKHYGAASTSYYSTPAAPIMVSAPAPSSLLYDSGIIERKEIGSMFFLTVGVGIGGALIIGNELYTGANEGAGEIGHVTLVPDGPLCKCGNSGCFEALCALGAIRKGYAEGINLEWETEMTRYADAPDKVTFRAIKKCIDSGDELTGKILSIAGKYMGMGIAVIVNLFDPQLIVIGGEIVPVLDYLHPFIVRELKTKVRLIPYKNVRYVPARLGELSGAYGAAAFVFKTLFNL